MVYGPRFIVHSVLTLKVQITPNMRHIMVSILGALILIWGIYSVLGWLPKL